MLDDARVRRPPVWRHSEEVCGFSDDERHLGHILKTGNHWTAFDSTRSNEDGTGFCLLGSFKSASAAKKAVEQATLEPRVKSLPLRAAAEAG
jgi:hypothetical protein